MTLYQSRHISVGKGPFKKVVVASLSAFVLVVASATWLVAQPAYIAATWNDDAVHFLDINLNNLSSFPTGAGTTDPNGLAFDGTRIYSGHFTTSQVVAYNMSGVEQFRWSAPIANLQGMEMVGNALAIYNSAQPQIQYRNPVTGALISTIPGQASIEGLAWDGAILWQLDDSVIYATDPATGAVIRTIPNPAINAQYGGTGLAAYGANQLTVASENGAWWKISSINGAVLQTGNNGLNMYGLTPLLTFVPEPGTAAMASLAVMLTLAGYRTGRPRTAIRS